MSGLISTRDLSPEQINTLLDRAQEFADGATSQRLHGKVVTTAFFEPSTRTRLSFELAAAKLGAEVLTFDPRTSSTTKGESFRDTVLTLTAMGADVLVIRHELADAARWAATWSGLPVVNAGTGRADHPTQALADALTLRQRFDGLDGLRVVIVGDIANSRVARSHLAALPALGVEVSLVGPPELMPAANPWQVDMGHDLEEVLGDVDVVYLLRIQKERGASGFGDAAGYSARYGMTRERLSMMKPNAVVMHPGPINRGVEIDDFVADCDRALILTQVGNGVPMRMAVLEAAGPGR